MADFLYLPAHKNIAMFGTASASVDADYESDWLNDGRPGRPARGSGGSFSATITNSAAGNVNFVAVINHNLDGAVTLGGGLSGTLSASATQQDGVPLNIFASITLASVSGFTVAGTTSAAAWVVGEVAAGEATTLTLPYYRSDSMSYADYNRLPDMDLSSIPGYDPGFSPGRTWECTWPALTVAELNGLLDAQKSQRNRTRPTVVVRRTSVNDALCGWITSISEGPSDVPNRVEVSMTFEEIPRMRWPT